MNELNEDKCNKSIKQIVDQNKSQHISIFVKRETEKKKKKKPYENKNECRQTTDNNKKKKNEIDSLSDSDDCGIIDGYENQMILSLQDIINSIPSNSVKGPNSNLQKTHTEWRWRFFDIKGRKLIEISKLPPSSPDTQRIYMDNTGNWVKYTLKGNWNQFLIDTRYCYIPN
jgi:hypothetical protein